MIAIIWPTRKLPRDALVDAIDLGILAICCYPADCYERDVFFSSDLSASIFFCARIV